MIASQAKDNLLRQLESSWGNPDLDVNRPLLHVRHTSNPLEKHRYLTLATPLELAYEMMDESLVKSLFARGAKVANFCLFSVAVDEIWQYDAVSISTKIFDYHSYSRSVLSFRRRNYPSFSHLRSAYLEEMEESKSSEQPYIERSHSERAIFINALHFAIEAGDFNAVTRFYELGADFSAIGPIGLSATGLVINKRDESLLRKLLKFGAPVESVCSIHHQVLPAFEFSPNPKTVIDKILREAWWEGLDVVGNFPIDAKRLRDTNSSSSPLQLIPDASVLKISDHPIRRFFCSLLSPANANANWRWVLTDVHGYCLEQKNFITRTGNFIDSEEMAKLPTVTRTVYFYDMLIRSEGRTMCREEIDKLCAWFRPDLAQLIPPQTVTGQGVDLAGRHPLVILLALKHWSSETVAAFLSHGSSLDLRDANGDSIAETFTMGSLDLFIDLPPHDELKVQLRALGLSFDVNIRDAAMTVVDGDATTFALMLPALQGTELNCLEVVKPFCEHRHPVYRSAKQLTLLQLASEQLEAEAVRSLLAAEANVLAGYPDFVPLTLAVEKIDPATGRMQLTGHESSDQRSAHVFGLITSIVEALLKPTLEQLSAQKGPNELAWWLTHPATTKLRALKSDISK